MALGDAGGDASPEGEAVGEGGGDGFGGEQTTDGGGVLAPRDDVGIENVAMRGEDLATGEIEEVVDRKIGVVIAGDESDGGFCGTEKGVELGAKFGGVGGIGAGAGIDGVAVKNELFRAGEERAKLREVADAAGAVAVVKVGNDADERAGHVEGCGEVEQCWTNVELGTVVASAGLWRDGRACERA